MLKDIVRYPSPPSVEYSTDVRVFDETLFSLLEDLKDTINENNLQALAAYQIANQYNVVVVKEEDGSFLELINPRVFNPQGKIETIETTAYFPGLSAKVIRNESISVIYQDRYGKDCSLKASGERAVLLQRKIDYTFGSTFINKLSKEEKKVFEKKLEYGSNIVTPESCPIFSYKDQINKITKAFLLSIFILIIVSLFVDDTSEYFSYALFLGAGTFLSTIIYFIVGYMEGKRYSTCTSCQIGNLIGTIVIHWMKLVPLLGIAYFII